MMESGLSSDLITVTRQALLTGETQKVRHGDKQEVCSSEEAECDTGARSKVDHKYWWCL